MNNSLLLHILVDVQYSSGQLAVPGACAGGYSNGDRIIDGDNWYRCENGQKQGPIGCYFEKIAFNVGDNITVGDMYMECQNAPEGGPGPQIKVMKFRQCGCVTPAGKVIGINDQFVEGRLRYECQPEKLVILACTIDDDTIDILIGEMRKTAVIDLNVVPDHFAQVIGKCEQHDDGSVSYNYRNTCQMMDKDENILASINNFECGTTLQFQGSEQVFRCDAMNIGHGASVKPKEEGGDNDICA